MSDLAEAKQAVQDFCEHEVDELEPDMVRFLVGREADRISFVMFGIGVDHLTEDQMSEIILWGAAQCSEAALPRYAAKRLLLDLADLSILYGGIDARLGVRTAHGDAGYLDVVLRAQVLGTRSGYEAMCEALEESWHDMRLSRDEGVAAVETVERMRVTLRRLEACDVEAVSEAI
jgi:hypothetical protein